MARRATARQRGAKRPLPGLTPTGAAGSPDFFLLLRDLRRLQIEGLLSVRLQYQGARAAVRSTSAPSHVYLSFGTTHDPDILAVVDEARRLLRMLRDAIEAEVVYGISAQPGRVSVLTRSMLGVLARLSLQIDVPLDDVARHLTHPTLGNIGLEHRPVVIILPALSHQEMSLLRRNIAAFGSRLAKTISTASWRSPSLKFSWPLQGRSSRQAPS
ncbi:MAG: hypothetical protein JO227_00385 [Acetobacteraceae bacterium]|nr:hypothetical protein [Acetobacteraceae bacterium]